MSPQSGDCRDPQVLAVGDDRPPREQSVGQCAVDFRLIACPTEIHVGVDRVELFHTDAEKERVAGKVLGAVHHVGSDCEPEVFDKLDARIVRTVDGGFGFSFTDVGTEGESDSVEFGMTRLRFLDRFLNRFDQRRGLSGTPECLADIGGEVLPRAGLIRLGVVREGRGDRAQALVILLGEAEYGARIRSGAALRICSNSSSPLSE